MGLSSTSRSAGLRRCWKALAAWAALAFLLFFTAGFLGGRAWLEGYLRSEQFRRFISRKTSDTMHADGRFAPLLFTGLSCYSEGFEALGHQDARFSKVQLRHLRAHLSLRRFFKRVWQVDQVTAERLDVHFDGPRVDLPVRTEAAKASRPISFLSSWLPDRVEVDSAVIREVNLAWGDDVADEGVKKSGSFRQCALTITPADGGWNLAGQGGTLAQGVFPPLEVKTFQMRYRAPMLFIQRAELRHNLTGIVNVTGELDFGNALDLRATLSRIPLAPLLTGDWRARLHGEVGGEVRFRSALPLGHGLATSGTLHLTNGQIEALPMLDQISIFTRIQQFRKLALSSANATFIHDAQRLQVSDFVAEAEGLLRIEGSFTVRREIIDGAFQVGVTPSTLHWLPGSQERVFTETRGGYVWAPMRLTGPVASPAEDLSPRLIAAARGAVIKGVENTVRESISTGKEAAKSAIDLLMPLFK